MDFFVTRHSLKPKEGDVESNIYGGISEEGVELARRSSKDILNYIEQCPKGAVIFLAGVSDEPRTRSTARVYGEQLKNLLADRGDYIVITENDIPRGKGYSSIMKEIKGVIDRHPGKRIIVSVPIFLRQFSLKGRGGGGWFTKEGDYSPYSHKLLEITGGDESKLAREWIRSRGKINGVRGPDPVEVARNYEIGRRRLEEFVKRYIGDRPSAIGIVGHSLELDAYLTYLLGGGDGVNLKTYDRIGKGGTIKETEMASVRNGVLTFRGKSYNLGRAPSPKGDGIEKILAGFTIAGFSSALLFLLNNITGNSIVNLSSSITSWISSFLLFVGLVAVFFWIKRKRNSLKKK